MPNIKYTTEQIKEAAALYYQYRSYAETARQCNQRWGTDFGRDQVKHWDNNSEVFAEGMKQEATATDKRLSAKMLTLENKALAFCIDKFESSPQDLKFKEVAWAAAVMHDKRQVLEGKATSISGPSKSFMDRLTEIESELANKSAERQAEGTFGDVVRFPGKE